MSIIRKLKLILLIAITAASTANFANAGIIGVDWQSTTQSSASGDLGGVNVSVNNLSYAGITSTFDMSGSSFSGAALASDQERLDYGFDSLWTATFDSSVSDLLLYAVYWRGPSLQNGDPTTFTYEFDRTFDIISGFTGGTGSGTKILSLTSTSFQFGILKFSGAVNSLSQIATNANSGSAQAMTFGVSVSNSSTSVPEPSTLAIFALGIMGLASRRFKKQS